MLQTLYQMIVGWFGQAPKNSFVDLAINELIVNFSNPRYNASRLSKNTNYTSDHFRRLFKNETGKTPTAYLIDLRMEHARKLLEKKDEISFSIKDIALLCGFSDPYYFSRLFKEKTGMSPTEYSH
jgi:AraC-like DNA-binding protein